MSDNQNIINDAEHKMRAYKELAHVFMSTGDTWIALHAQFLSDLASIVLLMIDSPAVKDFNGNISLIPALEGLDLDVKTKDAKKIMETIRKTVGSLLEDDDREKWMDNLASIDYFHGKRLSTESLKARKESRLHGMLPRNFMESRFLEADGHAKDSLDFIKKENKFEAARTAYLSDIAVFEAWLVGSSLSCGDDDLILTELRWSLAMTSLSAPRNPSDELVKTIGDIRSRLVWAVGQNDAKDLARHFCKII